MIDKLLHFWSAQQAWWLHTLEPNWVAWWPWVLLAWLVLVELVVTEPGQFEWWHRRIIGCVVSVILTLVWPLLAALVMAALNLALLIGGIIAIPYGLAILRKQVEVARRTRLTETEVLAGTSMILARPNQDGWRVDEYVKKPWYHA